MSAEKLTFPGKYTEEEKDMMDELAFNLLIEENSSMSYSEKSEHVYNLAEAMILERRKLYNTDA